MKILIVDDDLISLKVLEMHLQENDDEVICADCAEQALQIFNKGDVHLVITDWQMPNMDGLELIRQIRDNNDIYAYIILLTSNRETPDVVEGISSGADDYITKPFDKEELSVRVRAGKRILDLQNQLISANKRLEEASKTDQLTGLMNRRAMHESSSKTGSDHQNQSAYIMADIDKFKSINDNFGHNAGDAVLRDFSDRLKLAFRKTDKIFRVGGEEFLIIASDVDLEGAVKVTERARLGIEENPFILPEGKRIFITASFGIYFSKASENKDNDHLMKLADIALYESKKSGRNMVTVYSESAQS